MVEPTQNLSKKISGYGLGGVDTVLSVDDVAREAESLSTDAPTLEQLSALASGDPFVSIDGLVAGYGKMEIIHGFDMRVSAGQSLWWSCSSQDHGCKRSCGEARPDDHAKGDGEGGGHADPGSQAEPVGAVESA